MIAVALIAEEAVVRSGIDRDLVLDLGVLEHTPNGVDFVEWYIAILLAKQAEDLSLDLAGAADRRLSAAGR